MRDEFDVGDGNDPLVIPSKSESKQPNWLLVAIIVAAGWWFITNQSDSSPHPQPDDQSIIDGGDSVPINIDGCSIVLVFEKTAPTADQSELLTDFAFFDDLKSQGMQTYATFDEEQPEAKPYVDYANGRGLAPPMIAIVRDKQIQRAGPFTSRQSVMEFLQ